MSDGLGDRPSARLDRRTPLQAASTPNLDEIARESMIGSLYPVAPGVTPGSDTAHLSLFGLDPYVYYKGRGPFEAVGAGLDLSEGDVAFRGNFATVDDNVKVVDRRAGRSLPEARQLADYLAANLKVDGAHVLLKSTTEHRFALVIRGTGLDASVSDTDPHRAGERLAVCKPTSQTEAAVRTAQLVNQVTQRAHELLSSHPLNSERIQKGLPPANSILLRGAGKYTRLPGFGSLYGLRAAAVTGTAMVRGVCCMVGMDSPRVPGVTGDKNTDITAKASAALSLLIEHDFVFVHFKATDSAGHDRDPEGKVEMVEKLDELVGRVLDGLRGDEVVCVTGDHSTPVDIGEHTADPVPLLVHAQDVYGDGERFTEAGSAFGRLGRLNGSQLMPVLMNQANRIRKFGE
ncbi:MAG: 2,3-bisphosphoglycerate-independent phosphoglycerate mutase [Candidatus Marsarchaeota archaeon]|nr:2,3-bisphosphoglycerate-independent phosphoglycerate mutase [Candidatus Marsarchaeota archaeon]